MTPVPLQANHIISNLADLATSPSNRPTPVFDDEHQRTLLFHFPAGGGLGNHSSPHPAIIYFLQGEATLTLGDETMPANAGTWIHMPPKLIHGIAAHTPVMMLLQILK